jgi:hypothetical protein
MIRFHRSHIVCILIVACLSISLSSSAQAAGAKATLCYKLSAQDCKILTAAEAAAITEKSFLGDFDFSLVLASQGKSATISGKGTLSLSYDPTASDSATSLRAMQGKLDLTGTYKSNLESPAVNRKVRSTWSCWVASCMPRPTSVQ